MKKIDLISIDEVEKFKEYYKNHSWADSAEYMGWSKSLCTAIIKKYNLHKDRKIARNTCYYSTIENKYGSWNNYLEITQSKKTNTILDKYGNIENYNKQIYSDRKHFSNEEKQEMQLKKENTLITKYGSLEEAKRIQAEKRDKTWIDKYGSLENYRKYQQEKSKETCLNKYGVEFVWNCDEIRAKAIKNNSGETRKKAAEKAKQTQIDHYGSWDAAINNRVEKTKETCIDKYGVIAPCMITKCRLAGHTNNSKPNLEFAELLKLKNIIFEREFVIENFQYDFKINNYLIEINPTITHNSTLGYSNGKPKDKYYHQEKSKVAQKYGYRCIHIFEWDNIEEILFKLQNNLFSLNVTFEEPTSYERDISKKIKVIVYDDGSVEN